MSKPVYIAIHGRRNGLLRVDVLKKPEKGTREDYIKLTLCGSRRGDTAFSHAFTDWEAFEIARMLLWAVAKRQRTKAGIALEMME